MAKILAGHVVARSLKALGVDTVFFLVGGPMQEVGWECFRQGTKLIDVRHEQAAAMMAHGYSRVTGKVGVCMTASGPATVNSATGLAVAFDDCAPVVALGGSVAMGTRGTGSFEEMDQVELMRPITKRSWQVPSVERIPDFVGMAFRHATTGRPGPVYLDFPADMLFTEIDEANVKLPPADTSGGRPMGDEQKVEAAIKLLQSAERPIVIAGSGVLWSEAGLELQQFVEASQIPFFTTPLARGLIPEDHALCLGGARSAAWEAADVLLLIGTRTNFIIQHVSPPRFSKNLKIISVNIDAAEIGHNRPVEVGITGDAKAILKQLTPLARKAFAGRPRPSPWAEKLARISAEREARVAPQLNSDEIPIHPLRLCKEVRDFLPKDAILAVDGHEIMNFARQSIPVFYPRQRLNPGPSGCMGIGVPFGIAAKVARPEKPVMVLCGDGSFGFNAMEMDAAVRQKINIVVVVSNNGGWGGLPSLWPTGRNLGSPRYDKVVEGLGGVGYYVDNPRDIRGALESAFSAGRPALVNVITSTTRATTQPFSSTAAAMI